MAFLNILQKVFPRLIYPFIAATLTRRFTPSIHNLLTRYNETAFFLWALALIVVMAQTVNTLVNEPEDGWTEIWIALAAGAICCLLSAVLHRGKNRKSLSRTYQRRTITRAKNTLLAIWMAHVYMSPITAISGGSYVVWQNIINSWQRWKQRRNIGTGLFDPSKKEG